ncbi:MAG: cation diffusion facilitator family transporter [Candidatus Krumholzibacteria bacterium]|nr:cation diffusion facilitator family transporter [Candidatus Krumholzibacteria bacterium]MDP7021365.1 cation diffusion facilitator family transporter [Candidatus Krumholzibacteria bacterium]
MKPEQVTWWGIWSNVGLFLIKTLAGYFGRSQVLLADGVHSLSDLVSDLLALVALRLGRKPKDSQHPYGHGKIEDLGAFLVGLFLFCVAFGIAIKAVWYGWEGVLPERSVWLVLVALVSVLGKEWLFRLTLRVGEEHSSATLMANAWHHRSDAISSLASVFGTAVFLFFPNAAWLDSLAAIAVALFIGKSAWGIIRDSARDLVDTAPPAERLREFEEKALELRGVKGLRALRGRYYSRQIALDLDIEVDGSLSVNDGHEIARQLRRKILDTCPDVYRVMVHVDPLGRPDS